MMNEAKVSFRWRTAIGLLAVGFCACSTFGALNPITITEGDSTPTVDFGTNQSKFMGTSATMNAANVQLAPRNGLRDTGQCTPAVGGPNHTCPGGVPEGEWEQDATCGLIENGDNYNSGCNGTLEVFQPIACGDYICGTFATIVTGSEVLRDTDWYEIEVTVNTELLVEVTAEFDAVVGIITSLGTGLCSQQPEFPDFWAAGGFAFPGCNDPAQSNGTETVEDPAVLQLCVGPGIWWIFVSGTFDQAPIDCEDYTLRLTCTEDCSIPCCVGNNVCTDVANTTCIYDLEGAVADGVDCNVPDICKYGCDEAVRIDCNADPYDIDNSVNSDIANPPISCATGDSIGVLWFVFEATAESVEIFDCNSLVGDDSVFALYEGECSSSGVLTEIACTEDEDCEPGIWLGRICYGPTAQAAPLVVGNDYFVQFASWQDTSQGIYELEINCPCPDFTPSACCLPDGTCTIASPRDCEILEGTFQGAGTLCTDPEICDFGACCQPSGSCVFTTRTLCEVAFGSDEWYSGIQCDPNPCAGACCTFFFGSFSCAVTSSTECDGANDTFWTGELCDTQLFECPDHRVCQDIRDDDAKCQIPDFEEFPQDIVAGASDANPQAGNGEGTSRADDFTPSAASIGQVCWWGSYLDIADPQPAPPANEITDDFTVTYYDSDPVLQCPGNVLASFNQGMGQLTVTRTPTGERVLPDAEYPAGHQVWIYSATHAAVTVTPDECHWVEIVNSTDDGSGQQTRLWYWSTAPFGQGNGFSLVEPGQPATNFDCAFAGTWRSFDLAFCLDIDITTCIRCSDICVGSTVQEGEPTCGSFYVDTYNPGCSELEPAEPPIMTDLACGDKMCGKTGTYECDAECNLDADCPAGEFCQTNGLCTGAPFNCRDVDWYRFTVATTGTVEVSITGDFPYYSEMYNPFGADVCRESLGQILLLTGPACGGNTDTQFIAAGTYYYFVSTNDVFTGLPCDDYEYIIDVNCGGGPCEAQSVESCFTHTGVGRLCLDMTGGQVEPRGGVAEVDVVVDDASGFGGTATVDCGASPWAGTVNASTNSNTITLTFSPALPDESACTVELDCGASFCVRSLKGDVDRNGTVTTSDGSAVKPLFGQAADASNTATAADQDLNGTITTSDGSAIKALFGHSAPDCP